MTVQCSAQRREKLWPKLAGGGRGEIPRQCLTFTVSPDSSEALLMCLLSSQSNVSHHTRLYGRKKTPFVDAAATRCAHRSAVIQISQSIWRRLHVFPAGGKQNLDSLLRHKEINPATQALQHAPTRPPTRPTVAEGRNLSAVGRRRGEVFALWYRKSRWI